MAISLLFDLLLGLMLLWLAWRTLAAPSLFEACVSFIAFGLLMALSWVRLEAPDVALAEAAVGAGLTGVLLLGALGRAEAMPQRPAAGLWWRMGVALSALLLFLLLLGALLLLPERAPLPLQEALPLAAAAHPVTAVLLDFRAWDTLLEAAVLVLAVVAAWSLERGPSAPARPQPVCSEVLRSLVRLLLPFAVLSAGYLLWRGATAPGGAFQAGTVLAATGVLLLLADLWRGPVPQRPVWRLALLSGLMLFIAVALVTLGHSGVALDYPQRGGPALLLLVELGLSVTIALAFIALFVSGRRGSGG
ncbi:MAG: hydrogenase subunit MbhD domain-containing protein [Pseudomonadota bacterium]